jgi:hypothetical protein
MWKAVGKMILADPRQKHKTLSEKQLKQRLAEGLARVVEQLLSTLEALSLNPNSKPNQNKNTMVLWRNSGI